MQHFTLTKLSAALRCVSALYIILLSTPIRTIIELAKDHSPSIDLISSFQWLCLCTMCESDQIIQFPHIVNFIACGGARSGSVTVQQTTPPRRLLSLEMLIERKPDCCSPWIHSTQFICIMRINVCKIYIHIILIPINNRTNSSFFDRCCKSWR